jgi:hypothetical protein
MFSVLTNLGLALIWLGITGFLVYLLAAGKQIGLLDPAPAVVVSSLLVLWNLLRGYLAWQRMRRRQADSKTS